MKTTARAIVTALLAALLATGTTTPADARPMHSGKWKVCTTPAGKHIPHCKRRAAFLAQGWVARR